MNLTLDPHTGTDQQKAWVLAAQASCSYPFDQLEATILVTWAAVPSAAHPYMATSPNLDGSFTITIEPWADDATNPALAAVKDNVKGFYMESFIHELGHVIQFTRVTTDDAKTKLAACFWTPTSAGAGRHVGTLDDYNNVTETSQAQWPGVLQEGVSETIKVGFYSGTLVFGNRSNWFIDKDQWDAFVDIIMSRDSGFRDDFATGTMASDDTQGAMRLDARSIAAGTDWGAAPTWWELQEWWFVRAPTSLSVKTWFDDTAPGLPNTALPSGYDWWSAGINYFVGETDPGSFAMQSPIAADAAKAVGILGVASGQFFPGALDLVHDSFVLMTRGGDIMAAFIGQSGGGTTGGRLGTVPMKGCRMVTKAWLTPTPDPADPSPPPGPYWNQQDLSWPDQDVYLRFDADNTTGAVTLSVTRDEAGTDVIGSMTDATGLRGNGAALCIMSHKSISMQGPLLNIANGAPPSSTQRLFTVIEWNYKKDKNKAPYPPQGENAIAAGAPRAGFVATGR